MAEKNFEFDMGISFLYQDESEAEQIVAGLSDMNTFIYTRQQDKLVGPDIEEKLINAYGYNSRIVVVLYRKGWGKTPLTYVEEQAIRDRIVRDKTKKFLIIVNMTGKEEMPVWLSGDRTIWYDYNKFTLQGLIATIQHKVDEHGGLTRPETIIEIAQRKKEHENFLNKRYQFLDSQAGADKGIAEYNSLKAELKKSIESLKDIYQFKISEGVKNLIIRYEEYLTLNVDWDWSISNRLHFDNDKAKVAVTIFKKRFDRNEYDRGNFDRIHEELFYFNLFYPDLIGWYQYKDTEFIPTKVLAEQIITKLLEKM